MWCTRVSRGHSKSLGTILEAKNLAKWFLWQFKRNTGQSNAFIAFNTQSRNLSNSLLLVSKISLSKKISTSKIFNRFNPTNPIRNKMKKLLVIFQIFFLLITSDTYTLIFSGFFGSTSSILQHLLVARYTLLTIATLLWLASIALRF